MIAESEVYVYMNKKNITGVIIVIFFLLVITLCANTATAIMAKTSKIFENIYFNKSKITLKVGESYKLKLKGVKKHSKWKCNNKKVVSVNTKGLVRAKKKGKANITVKYRKRKFVCKVKVKEKDYNVQNEMPVVPASSTVLTLQPSMTPKSLITSPPSATPLSPVAEQTPIVCGESW